MAPTTGERFFLELSDLDAGPFQILVVGLASRDHLIGICPCDR
jgi:hypothetical protein